MRAEARSRQASDAPPPRGDRQRPIRAPRVRRDMTDADADQGAIEVDFGDDGLVPAVAQDADSGEVLMLAYVSPEALERTRETGEAHYYSRSRDDELWHKGRFLGAHPGSPRGASRLRRRHPAVPRRPERGGVSHGGTARVSTGQSTVNTSASASSTRTRCTDAGWGRLRPRPRSRRGRPRRCASGTTNSPPDRGPDSRPRSGSDRDRRRRVPPGAPRA